MKCPRVYLFEKVSWSFVVQAPCMMADILPVSVKSGRRPLPGILLPFVQNRLNLNV